MVYVLFIKAIPITRPVVKQEVVGEPRCNECLKCTKMPKVPKIKERFTVYGAGPENRYQIYFLPQSFLLTAGLTFVMTDSILFKSRSPKSMGREFN